MKARLLLLVAILCTRFTPIDSAIAQEDIDCTAPRLVLELPSEHDPEAILATFGFLQARNLRTLMLARPDIAPDTLRLAIATGNQVALTLDIPGDLDAQIDAWESLMLDIVGHTGLRVAHVSNGAGAVREALEGPELEYTLLADAITGCDTPPELLTITVDDEAVGNIYNAITGGAIAHDAVNWQYAGPTTGAIEATEATPEAFRAAHLVVIDPGHTRMDRGASIQGADGEYVTEHWSNLERAQALRSALREQGWATALAHDDGWLFKDVYHGFDFDRDGIINNHDSLMFRAQFAYYASQRTGRRAVILMLHADSFGDASAVGYSLFYPDPYETADDQASYRLALYTGDHLGATWQAMGVANPLRGIHPGRAYGRERGPGAIFDIIDWRYRELPAARHEQAPLPFIGLLIEAGMASNPAEAEILATAKGNAWLGESHAEAIEEWMHAELALLRFSQDGYHDDPPTLTAEQVEAIALNEIKHGDTADPPRMTFTFDMGTSAYNWDDFRETLRQYDLTTTFFLTGDFIRGNPAVVRQMLADGHDLQNHSDTHPNFTGMTADEIQAELQACQDELDTAIGAHLPMRLWRAPFGARNYDVMQAAAAMGLIGVWWSEDGDTTGWQEGVTADDVYNYVTWTFAPGKIYVGHLNSYADMQAFPRVMDDALAEGYVVGNLWSVFTPEQVALLGTPAP